MHWSSENCQIKSGFICEENYYASKYTEKIAQKRQTVYEANSKLSSEYADTQEKLREINRNTRSRTNDVIMDYQQSSNKLLSDMKTSIENMIKKKPYVALLLASSMTTFNNIVAEHEAKFSNISQNSRQNIEGVHVDAERTMEEITSDFKNKLVSNSYKIDEILVS